jgi:hypothetical protein
MKRWRCTKNALKLRQSFLSPDHPDIVISKDGIARVYLKIGPNDEALAIMKEKLPKHPHFGSAMDSVAVGHYAMGQYDALRAPARFLSTMSAASESSSNCLIDQISFVMKKLVTCVICPCRLHARRVLWTSNILIGTLPPFVPRECDAIRNLPSRFDGRLFVFEHV